MDYLSHLVVYSLFRIADIFFVYIKMNYDININNLYNNKCNVRSRLDVRGLVRACDASLEPHWRKNDQGMNFFWFARAARPQCAKMCFFTT